jgi:AcrR family transcriptional regulator
MPEVGAAKRKSGASRFDRSGDTPEITRQKLMNAAVDLFLSVGYHNVSVREITEYAGVGKGTFYVHFASKRDLLLAYFQHVRERFEAVEARASRPDLDFLAKAAVRIGSSLGREERWNKVVTFLRISTHDPDPEIVPAALEAHMRIAEPAKKELEEAIRQGIVRPVDPELLTLASVGMQEVLAWRMQQDDTYDADTVLTFLTEVFSRAFMRLSDEDEALQTARVKEAVAKAKEAAKPLNFSPQPD